MSTAALAREKLGTTSPTGEVIDEIIGSKASRKLAGDDGPDRLIAGHKGRYALLGNGGADHYVLAPSGKDFEQI
ncbi:MAG: hypothetical protein ACKO5F_16395 [Synechococcus sp.]